MRSVLSAAVGLAALTGAASAQDLQNFDAIERGRYLAVLGDCAACHTVPGGQPFAGGLVLQTPFGKLVAPNITFAQGRGGGGGCNNAQQANHGPRAIGRVGKDVSAARN